MKQEPKKIYQTPNLIVMELKITSLMTVTSQGDSIYNRNYNLRYGGVDEYGEDLVEKDE